MVHIMLYPTVNPCNYYCNYYYYTCYNFLQNIYNCTPETNHISTVYNVADILWLQNFVYVKLFPKMKFCKYYNYFQSLC